MTNIIIRAAEVEDTDDLHELFTRPKAQRETLQMPFQTRSSVRARLEDKTTERYMLVAVVEDSQKVVGSIGLVPTKRPRQAHTAHIGMAVHDDYHGQGIGSKLMEAALEIGEKWLGLKRIELTVYTDNEPAINLYKKFGFITEGTLHKYALRDGVYVDAFIMARIQD